MDRFWSCPSPIFWLLYGNHYTLPVEGLCQISHFIPEVNDFNQILALAPLPCLIRHLQIWFDVQAIFTALFVTAVWMDLRSLSG